MPQLSPMPWTITLIIILTVMLKVSKLINATKKPKTIQMMTIKKNPLKW